MQYTLRYQPVCSVLEITLDEGDVVVAQPNSMLAMTSGIRLAARIRRGDGQQAWYSGFKRMLGGESFFLAEFRAIRDGQLLSLAPEAFGDILELPLGPSRNYFLTQGSYLANVGPCNLQIRYGGIKGALARKGFFLLHTSGDGTVFCQSYGAIVTRELAAGETFVVDNRFVIAFSDTVTYQFVKATSNVKDALMSGEGFVNRYTGPGHIFYQTRGKPAPGLLSRVLDATF